MSRLSTVKSHCDYQREHEAATYLPAALYTFLAAKLPAEVLSHIIFQLEEDSVFFVWFNYIEGELCLALKH